MPPKNDNCPTLDYAPKPPPEPLARKLGRWTPRVANGSALALIVGGFIWFVAETLSHWGEVYPRGEVTYDQHCAALLIGCGFLTAATVKYAQSLARR